MKQYDRGHPATVDEYNFAVRHRRQLQTALEHNSNAVVWYASQRLNEGLRIPAGKLDPAGIVAATRQNLGLSTRAQWHAFLSLPASYIKGEPKLLKPTVAILVQANPDDEPYSETGQERRNAIVNCLSQIRPTLEQPWSHGDPATRRPDGRKSAARFCDSRTHPNRATTKENTGKGSRICPTHSSPP